VAATKVEAKEVVETAAADEAVTTEAREEAKVERGKSRTRRICTDRGSS
jgi:hypothetical protein